MHSPSAHRTLRPGQKLFANESNFRLAYTGIINQIRLTINHSGLFYTLKTVKSSCKVKHFVNFANFSVDFGLFLLRFFTACQFFCSLPCPAQKSKASALRRPGPHCRCLFVLFNISSAEGFPVPPGLRTALRGCRFPRWSGVPFPAGCPRRRPAGTPPAPGCRRPAGPSASASSLHGGR